MGSEALAHNEGRNSGNLLVSLVPSTGLTSSNPLVALAFGEVYLQINFSEDYYFVTNCTLNF